MWPKIQLQMFCCWWSNNWPGRTCEHDTQNVKELLCFRLFQKTSSLKMMVMLTQLAATWWQQMVHCSLFDDFQVMILGHSHWWFVQMKHSFSVPSFFCCKAKLRTPFHNGSVNINDRNDCNARVWFDAKKKTCHFALWFWCLKSSKKSIESFSWQVQAPCKIIFFTVKWQNQCSCSLHQCVCMGRDTIPPSTFDSNSDTERSRSPHLQACLKLVNVEISRAAAMHLTANSNASVNLNVNTTDTTFSGPVVRPTDETHARWLTTARPWPA